jgi:hypothetical protein
LHLVEIARLPLDDRLGVVIAVQPARKDEWVVADFTCPCVYGLSRTGKVRYQIGGPLGSVLRRPVALRMASDGVLYVVDMEASRIVAFRPPSPSILRSFPASALLTDIELGKKSLFVAGIATRRPEEIVAKAPEPAAYWLHEFSHDGTRLRAAVADEGDAPGRMLRERYGFIEAGVARLRGDRYLAVSTGTKPGAVIVDLLTTREHRIGTTLPDMVHMPPFTAAMPPGKEVMLLPQELVNIALQFNSPHRVFALGHDRLIVQYRGRIADGKRRVDRYILDVLEVDGRRVGSIPVRGRLMCVRDDDVLVVLESDPADEGEKWHNVLVSYRLRP